METLFQQAPPERIVDVDGDELKSLRALRARYLAKYEATGQRDYYLNAWASVSALAGETDA